MTNPTNIHSSFIWDKNLQALVITNDTWHMHPSPLIGCLRQSSMITNFYTVSDHIELTLHMVRDKAAALWTSYVCRRATLVQSQIQ